MSYLVCEVSDFGDFLTQLEIKDILTVPKLDTIMNANQLKFNLANIRVLTKAIKGHLNIDSSTNDCTTFSIAVPIDIPKNGSFEPLRSTDVDVAEEQKNNDLKREK